MSVTRNRVKETIDKIGIGDWVRNIQVFGEKIMIDAESPTPAMHDKKNLEDTIVNGLSKEFPEAKVEVRVFVKPQPKKPEISPENPKILGKEVPGIQNVIAVASGKGGVGKSTVASNLAISLKNMGFSVGLLDADIHGPSVPLMFDVENAKPQSVQVEGRSMMQPVESYGIKLLSIGFFTEPDQAVVWRGAMASKALQQLIHDSNWGKLDFLIIDLPPGTGDIQLSLVQQIPVTGAVIVSTPQSVALSDARKGLSMFKLDAINVPVLGIVENMSYFTPEELPENKYYIFGQNGAKNLAEKHNVPFLGEVPLIQSIREAGDVGRPAALQGNTTASVAYHEIAKNMVASLAERNTNLPPTEIVRITTMAGCSK
ncbi:Mrp/NBP35 family ATP-binding protein [Weeksellaceae bacterium TAE3-ERU29]|nr:Mrp/NBP35 family ATP-binding protein [Weeksellaceae bacterium TAE3-ERU29]